jgi:hypothetical protein
MKLNEDDPVTFERIRTRSVNFKAPVYIKIDKSCPSGKTRHSTKKRALGSAAFTCKRTGKHNLRVYKCPQCRDFHLTSTKQRRV